MFKKAIRERVKLKLAITGPSGGGKTYSALRLATGMGGKIAFVDTENGSGSLYSDKFNFDVAEISPPYTIDKYIKAIDTAIEDGYDILIIDSITHAWAGEGGILSRKSDYDSQKGGNSYANWRLFTKEHETLMAKILSCNIHLISTMRSKQDYQLIENSSGKSVPQKMGLAPIQREGVEYEFTTVFDIQMSHKAQSSKDRTELFTGEIFQVTEETGKKIMDWCKSGRSAKEIKQESRMPVSAEIERLLPLIKDEESRKKAYTIFGNCDNMNDLMRVLNRAKEIIDGQG